MKNIVHNIDNMEFMKDIPVNYYDLAIVDPPYGIHEKLLTSSKKVNKSNKFALMYQEKNWDKKRPDIKYFNEIRRISKNQIICGGNYFADLLPASRGWIIWDKQAKKMTVVNDELLWTSFDLSIKTFSRCHGLDKGFMNKEGKNIHPTQKPVALYKWLLQNYAKPGYKIFDSHVGSGSIRIACHDMGFEFEGCELDKDYWQAQEDRYQNHISQGDLFGTDEMQGLIFNG